MKNKKYFILGSALLTICFLSSFLLYTQASPPPEYNKVKPTDWSLLNYGYYISGDIEDVWNYDGDYMRFRQSSFSLQVKFEFPNEKCSALYFYFTDTATWPYEFTIYVYAYYTNAPVQILGWGIKDGNHEFALYSLQNLDYVRIDFNWCWYQYMNIDLLVAKRT